MLSNLTNQKVHLNYYSMLTFKFVIPVLNETAAKILQTFGTTETSKTTKYFQILDKFFKCLNVRSLEMFGNQTSETVVLMKMTKNSLG